jgi:hypothetical protein
MSGYKVKINTDSYKCLPCSKKQWQNGTMNDMMLAINGWHTTERNLQQVRWRLEMFAGNGDTEDKYIEYDSENSKFLGKYGEWRNKRCNTLRYYDRLCGVCRIQDITGYGWKQGYFDIDIIINELMEKGSVKIPFSYLYDTRQYYNGMDGCYMEITKA